MKTIDPIVKTKLMLNATYLADNIIPFMKKEEIEKFEDGYAMWVAGVLAGKIDIDRKLSFTLEEELLDINTAYAYLLYAVDNSSILEDDPNTYEDTISIMIDNKYSEDNPSDEDLEEINSLIAETEDSLDENEEESEDEQEDNSDIGKENNDENHIDE